MPTKYEMDILKQLKRIADSLEKIEKDIRRDKNEQAGHEELSYNPGPFEESV